MSLIVPPTASQIRHSVTFFDPDGSNEKDTYNSWHLVPSKKPVFPLPNPRFSQIEVTGANGSIDTSGLLLDSSDPYGVTFENRQGSFEFYVEDYGAGYSNFDALVHAIANSVHGRYKKAVLRDDPNYAYFGRWKIEDAHTEENWSVIVLWFDLKPFAITTGNVNSL